MSGSRCFPQANCYRYELLRLVGVRLLQVDGPARLGAMANLNTNKTLHGQGTKQSSAFFMPTGRGRTPRSWDTRHLLYARSIPPNHDSAENKLADVLREICIFASKLSQVKSWPCISDHSECPPLRSKPTDSIRRLLRSCM